MKPTLIPFVGLMLSASLTNASIIVQELFDHISTGSATLNGAGSTATSIGLTGPWVTNGSLDIFTSDESDVEGSILPGLASNGGAPGKVRWANTSNNWNRNIYASRQLATPINFGVNRVIYFSVRLYNPGDTGMGIGLASGSGAADTFVGAGFTWNNAQPLSNPTSNIAGNSAYISHDVLGSGAPQQGVYGIRAYEGQNTVNGNGLLVGRITIKATGNDVIHIKRYAENAVIDNNLDAIIWSATSEVDSSMIASRLVLWMNGADVGELDAIRFGDTWTDVTGVPLIDGQPGLSGASVTGITANSAQASVNLFTSPANVTLKWDTINQETGEWGNSNPLGNRPVGPVTGASITGLEPDMVYFYRFHAVNTAAEPDLESWSEAGTSFTTALTGLQVPDLSLFATSPIEVEVTWGDMFATETGFLIQRSPTGANTWATVGTAPANSFLFNDKHSGLNPGTKYDYRVIATSASGNSDPSDISSVTTPPATPLDTKLLVNFNGTLAGTVYTLGQGEVDQTLTFKANGAPNISNGLATINPGNEGGQDGFDIDPNSLGDLRTQNWVAETLVTYQASGVPTENSPVVMDVQGDCNLRLGEQNNAAALQMFYWNGSSGQQSLPPLPPNGVKVHLAFSWNASTATLTGYINGVSFGSISNGPFATPDMSNLSFGYFGRSSFEGRGIDGVLDAVAFQAGTATFNPATGFLILPTTQSFASWIAGYPVGTLNGFNDDADHDGISNGVEAFLGTDPSKPGSGAITQISTNRTATTFTHPQAQTPLSDVTGSYQWSLDLGTWYAGNGVAGPSGGPTVSIPTVSPVGGTATVTATSSVPLQRLFIRVTAVKN